MIPELAHFAINWVDGMKIAKQHFLDLEMEISDKGRDVRAAFLNDDNYGLLPMEEETNSLEIKMDILSNGFVRISIPQCRAITNDGERIEITPNTRALLGYTPQTDMQAGYTQDQYIVISIDKNMPAGIPNPDENPPRHPFSLPNYRLALVSAQEINLFVMKAKHLVIGKLVFNAGSIMLDERFIPAAMSVRSHPTLWKFASTWYKQMTTLYEDLIKLIQKVKTQTERNTTLAIATLAWAEKLSTYLVYRLPSFRLFIIQQAPINLVEFFAAFAFVCQNHLETMLLKEKEQMFNYFFEEWTKIKPIEYEELVRKAAHVQYDHYDMYKSLEAINNFIAAFTDLFSRLANAAEYIGHKKLVHTVTEIGNQRQPQVEEKPIAPPPPKKFRFGLND